MIGCANPRSALDARTVLCFHIEAHWPGASESGPLARQEADPNGNFCLS
jgi:hypothetical protein